MIRPTSAHRVVRALRRSWGARTWMCCAALLVFVPAPVAAGQPEYMRLHLEVGQALEVKGFVNEQGTFVASDLEELPRPRKPKLRGRIQEIDHEAKTLAMYGVVIGVTEKTSFGEDGAEAVPFADLAAGQRIEVSCEVGEAGRWRARKIRTQSIKPSDKIKGTISRVQMDGVPPDTLEISGLVILLDGRTDANSPGSRLDRLEKNLFGHLARAHASGLGGGVSLAGGRVFLTGQYRHNLRLESDFDLSLQFQSDQEDTQPEGRLELSGYWSDRIRTFMQARVRKEIVISSDRDAASKELEADFTQWYLLWRNIGGKRVALQVGRQDFDEPREWLFDEYLDAVRASYYGEGHLVLETAFIHALDPIKEKFDTWTDFFVMARWFTGKRSAFGAYVLARSDSDEDRNRQPVWWGLRYSGEVHGRLRPWAEMAFMRGEDKGESLRAWAWDLGTTILEPRLFLSPSLTLGLAVGSGDEVRRDGVQQTFRQTGYQDNYARLGGVTSIRYYGAILDPELSNLRISTIGLGVLPVAGSSIDVVYHGYHQHRPADKLRGSDLVDPPARPNGRSDDIGWELDVVFAPPRLWNSVGLKWTLGFFSPGDAFDPRQEDALLNKIDLTIGF